MSPILRAINNADKFRKHMSQEGTDSRLLLCPIINIQRTRDNDAKSVTSQINAIFFRADTSEPLD